MERLISRCKQLRRLATRYEKRAANYRAMWLIAMCLLSLATLFADAGVTSAAITTHPGTARFPDIRIMVEADLRGWLPVMGVILSEDQINRILYEAEHALRAYATPDGRVTFRLSAHLVTAKKPSPGAKGAR